MRVVCYPADRAGCGYHRIRWAAEALVVQGADVTIAEQGIGAWINSAGKVIKAELPEADVIVVQRTTHRDAPLILAHAEANGIAVVVDIDDDLSAIHPSNPAYKALHPQTELVTKHSWRNLELACKAATLVTVSTPALLRRYGHGKGRVVQNRVPDHFLDVPHTDSTRVAWPASAASHPDDLAVTGGAIARLEADGIEYSNVDGVPFHEWPNTLARIGIGITPLADTRFNKAKSGVKFLELIACGVPVVASPSSEYVRLHEHLSVGFIANNPRQWYSKITALTNNAALRLEQSQAGREAARTYTISQHADMWWESWTVAAKQRRARAVPV